MEADITFEEGYSDVEVDLVSGYSDDDDDDMDSSDEGDTDSEGEKPQEAMNYAVDYSFGFQGSCKQQFPCTTPC
ncbi:hypothetical protein DVH05_007205 [Phytophthora capsici]|nr:hypothetical protein DVH05_007205 [Phytophthora capsici]